ncbi:predicted protein [Arabidopsis lyrata subsp. lyrata]|uniref:Predicted protein n=1 Tax=Arabidopsis lyrata subsp. lyrata TaxID=81972 RepID=D7KRV5_ARALL|nr:predicted protein [Arabidopsis lyrata subsp. lyrata]
MIISTSFSASLPSLARIERPKLIFIYLHFCLIFSFSENLSLSLVFLSSKTCFCSNEVHDSRRCHY